MKVFKSQTRTSVTEYIERMTSQKYQQDDLNDIFVLCEAINLQQTGPKEASKALRHVFKYGTKHSHLRALTILQALMENCEKIHFYVASHKFIDKLRNLALSPSTDDEVHKKLMILFAQWSDNFGKKPGMENLTSLYNSVSNKHSGSNVYSSNGISSIKKKPISARSSSSSSSSSSSNISNNNAYNNDKKEKRKSTSSILLNSTKKNSINKKKQQASDKPEKKYTPAQVNQEIGSAIQNATNLVNALTLLNPGIDFENDPELQEYVTKCKTSSEQLIKIIPTIVDGAQLGPLLQCNDQLQEALEAYSNHCKDDKNSDLDDVTSNFEKIGLHEPSKGIEDLIDFGSYVSSTRDNVYSSNSIDNPFEDPFADPITPNRTPDPESEKSIKTRPKWTEV